VFGISPSLHHLASLPVLLELYRLLPPSTYLRLLTRFDLWHLALPLTAPPLSTDQCFYLLDYTFSPFIPPEYLCAVPRTIFQILFSILAYPFPPRPRRHSCVSLPYPFILRYPYPLSSCRLLCFFSHAFSPLYTAHTTLPSPPMSVA